MDSEVGTTKRSSAGPRDTPLVARLESVVATNRVTIAVVFPLVGAALMVASAWGWLPALLAFHPLLLLSGAAVMRLPVAATLAPLLDRRAVAGLGVLAGYTYAIEFVGLRTGWPYGEFTYGVALGPALPGGVPLGLPIYFVPLVVDAYLLCLLALGGRAALARYRVPAAVGTVLAIDLVLDPAAVGVGLWSFAAEGAYYGVPASNYAGWLLSAAVGVVVLDRTFDAETLRARIVSCPFALDDLLSFVLLWGAVAVAVGAVLPVGLAVGFAAVLWRLGRLDFGVSASGPTAGGPDVAGEASGDANPASDTGGDANPTRDA